MGRPGEAWGGLGRYEEVWGDMAHLLEGAVPEGHGALEVAALRARAHEGRAHLRWGQDSRRASGEA